MVNASLHGIPADRGKGKGGGVERQIREGEGVEGGVVAGEEGGGGGLQQSLSRREKISNR